MYDDIVILRFYEDCEEGLQSTSNYSRKFKHRRYTGYNGIQGRR